MGAVVSNRLTVKQIDILLGREKPSAGMTGYALAEKEKKMSKIYVCERGCRYEGGAAFAASTNLVRAWKLVREARIEAETSNHDKIRLVGKNYWLSDYDYFCIREYENA